MFPFNNSIFLKVNFPNEAIGFLNSDQFQYTSLDPPTSKNVPPLSINVQLVLFGKSFNFTMKQQQGALSDSSLKSKIYSLVGEFTNITQSVTEKMVKNSSLKLRLLN